MAASNSYPVEISRRRSPPISWWAPACGFAMLLALWTLPLPHNGAIAGLPSPCGFYHLTGYPCPLCGLTRSLVCAMHGDWVAALWWHPFGPIVLLGLGSISLWPAVKVLWPRKLKLVPTFAKTFGYLAVVMLMLVWLARLLRWIPSPF